MPPPTGVVSGPLMPIRYSRNAATVSSGNQLPVSSNAFCPASTSFHAIRLPCFVAAASMTSCAAGQMSTPVPSPSMNGMMGSSAGEGDEEQREQVDGGQAGRQQPDRAPAERVVRPVGDREEQPARRAP